jgi:small GTP-binding protein
MTDATPSRDRDFDQTLSSFEEIQAALNYKQAQDALRDLVYSLDLTPQEQAGLEAEVRGLVTMLDKLEQQVVHLAVFGMVGRGKSSVLNALLGQPIFQTGPTHGVTRISASASWDFDSNRPYQLSSESFEGSDRELRRVSLPSLGLSRVELIDTPGIDEVDGETREALARQVAQQADLILFVIAGDITQVEHTALSELRQSSKPMLLVFNKIDQYPEADRQAIYHKIRDERVRELLSPDEIVLAAAAPLISQVVQSATGSRNVQLVRGEPQVQDLKLKILEVLQREGKALVALNSMLFADRVNEHVIQRKLLIRDRAANQMIWNAVMTKAIAIALNPLTVVDLLSGAVIDVTMILTLSRLYGISMTQAGAVGLLQRIALSMGGVSASELLANLGLSSLKAVLGLTTPTTAGLSLAPYVLVAITQAGVAGVSTYGIGQVAKAYLANGASWGPDGPKAVISRILDSLDETSILSRIRAELHAKLAPCQANSEG